MPASLWPIFYVLVSAMFMATIGIFARFAALPAEHITFYRLAIGASCVLLYLVVSRQQRAIWHKPAWSTVLNGVMLASFMVCYIEAMHYTSMANAIMLIYLAPLFAAVVAHFIYQERLGIASVVAIMLALFGFAMMMNFKWSFTHAEQEQIGLFYGVLSMLSYGTFILLNRKKTIHSPYQSTLIQLLVGSLCVLPFVLTHPVAISFNQGLWLLAIGIIPGFLAMLFAVKALRELPAMTFSTLAYIEPVAVVIMAWLIFNEQLGILQQVGCGLIIAAGIAQSFVEHSNKKRRALKVKAETYVSAQ